MTHVITEKKSLFLVIWPNYFFYLTQNFCFTPLAKKTRNKTTTKTHGWADKTRGTGQKTKQKNPSQPTDPLTLIFLGHVTKNNDFFPD